MSLIKSSTEPTYSSLKADLKTGDIIMFQGFTFTGAMIMGLELFEKIEPFTHVGIVVKLPKKGKMEEGLYFWQAMPADATNQFGPDYFKEVKCNGCVAVPLDSVIDWVHGVDVGKSTDIFKEIMLNGEYKLILRKLNKSMDPEDASLLEAYMNEIAGRSFSSPVESGMVMDYYEGYEASNSPCGKSSSDATFFCSKLVSQTFQKAGLLPEDLITNSVLPGHFGQSQDNKKLKFLRGYGFGKDIYFKPE